MPSVRDNTKFKCLGCGTILDIPAPFHPLPECPGCGGTAYDQIAITPTCDFCASPNPSWAFPCEDFVIAVIPGGPSQGFKGEWAACDTCKGLIEDGDKDGLAQRAFALDPDKQNPLPQLLVRQAHNGFFVHRTGPPVPDN